MTKLVCRILNAHGELLGWCEHQAVIRGDGLLRASSPVVIDIDVCGTPTALSIHWADVNVETRVPMPEQWLPRGQKVTVFPAHAPMVEAGRVPQALPPVTTKAVMVDVPVGALGAVGVA